MRQRVISVLVLLPVGLILIYLGGWPFAAFIALIIGLAAWEYARLFRNGGYAPSAALSIGGAVALVLARQVFEFRHTDIFITVLVMLAITWHVISFERGQTKAAFDFAITLSAIFYLGWLGAYFISLRNLENGLYWFLIGLPAAWIADTGAYVIGKRSGKHRLAPRVSPNKTWEGYFGGILVGVPGTALLAALIHLAYPAVSALHGAILGLAIAVLTTLGDLGESLIKRQFGVKDASQIIPGHGGVMDRIDSWLWASVITYYLVTWLW